MLSPRLSQSERIAFWNKVAEEFIPMQAAYSTLIYREGEIRLIQQHLAPLRDKKLLKLDLWNEVHNTSILFWAEDQGMKVTAVDISPVLVEKARQNFLGQGRRPDFHVGDIRKLPFPDNTFDRLYTMGTIEHVPDPEKAILEIYRVLVPGGKAIIGVPYRYEIFGRALITYLGNKAGLLPYGDEMSFSWPAFKQLLSTAPFELTAQSGVYTMPWWLRYPDIWLYQHARPLCLLLRPFLWLTRRLDEIPMLLKYSGLIAAVVEKPRGHGGLGQQPQSQQRSRVPQANAAALLVR